MYNHDGHDLFVIDGPHAFFGTPTRELAEQIRGELDQMLLRLSQ